MKKEVIKKSIIIFLVICLVVVLGTVMNHLTGEDIIAKESKKLVVQSTLEMKETNINSQVAGQIKQLNVKEGDTVKKGQILAVIDSDNLLAQREKAQAAIATVYGQISSAEAAKAGAQAALKKVQTGAKPEEIAQAKANFDLAQANYDRKKSLFENSAISKSELDSVAAQYEVAKQQYNLVVNGATREELDQAQANLDAASASITTLQGQLEQALAEVEVNIGKTEITAPTDGITQLSVEEGELISTGLPIAVITDTAAPWVECKVMEDNLSKVKLDQSVEVTFQAYPGEVFQGRITQINKSADFAVKRATNSNGEFDILAYGVKVELQDVDVPLYAGMTVFVNFGEEKKK
ncbi:Macrolide export protein MacA [Pelotomaculum schinkii]|uniref:Macrolide export protein MacA n=1 Tax=Pelotomaculum schinkii TaxID=78350 RepID=A0A4Y7RGL7_9FIRM|nr:efflux RND transporter periplasmic adaptor subunit [Pelotomaculum schinkii]TEB07956.1 Macrolide export protein MacA [Pelotomaculum schinkii]